MQLHRHHNHKTQNMKKITIIFALIAIAFTSLKLTSQNFEWAKQLGGTTNDQGIAITVDAVGNVYTTGRFTNTADFDPGNGTFNLTSVGSRDIFISKLNATGDFIWANQLGGTTDEIANSITADAAGNIYITGNFEGTADFDPSASPFNLTSIGMDDIFIVKLNTAGNFLWAKQIGGTSPDLGYGIITDASGSVYITGTFEGTVDFDPGAGVFNLSSAVFNDAFICKLDSAGNFIWAKQFAGTSSVNSNGINIDSSGNIYVAGDFFETVDFDPNSGTFNLTAAGNFNDIFVCKLNSSGNLVWAKQMGGNGIDIARAISIDASGNVLTTGDFGALADFDPGAGTFPLSPIGLQDTFVSKLDASGNFVWTKQFGGTDIVIGNSITTDATGKVFSTGYFQGTADLDPGSGTLNFTSQGIGDAFISSLNTDGESVWAIQLGGMDICEGKSIYADDAGKIYTTGYFGETIDFDPSNNTFNLTSTGADDVFVYKISQDPLAVDEHTDNDFLMIPNPTSGQITIYLKNNSETINLEIRNILGQVQFRKTYNHTSKIDLSIEGQSGIYFLEIQNENNKIVKKLVKK
ncbi:MAG: hypothetical protein COA40_07975 [Aequorivita sp.]|nr:MAG: hypothetical protein COA40_07975 [Aequorivita sp.]